MLRACEARAVVINAHPHSLVMQPSDEHLIETTHAFGICNRGCTIECDLCDRFVMFDILLRESHQLMEFATENTPVYVADHFGGRVIICATENKLWHCILCCRQPVYASQLPHFFQAY